MNITNSKYSEKEWKTISRIAQLTGLLMSTAAYSGVDGTKAELKASRESIYEGKLRFPDNELIASIIPEGSSKDQILDKIEAEQQRIISKYTIKTLEDLKNFQSSVFSDYEEVVYNINKKETGLVVNEFKLWLLNIAEQVAVSAIEGTAFGLNTDPFSEEEKIIFNKIEKTLKKIT